MSKSEILKKYPVDGPIFLPDPAQNKRKFALAGFNNTKENYYGYLRPFIDVIVKCGWTCEEGKYSQIKDIIGRVLQNKANATKQDMERMLSYVIFSKKIVHQVFNRFPIRIRRLFYLLGTQRYVKTHDLPTDLKEAFDLQKNRIYEIWDLRNEYSAFKHYLRQNSTFTFAEYQRLTSVYQDFPVFFESALSQMRPDLLPIDDPEGNMHFNAAEYLGSELTHLSWMLRNGEINPYERSMSGFKVGPISKFQKAAQVKELFGDEVPLSLRRIRSKFMLETFYDASPDKLDGEFESCIIRSINDASMKTSLACNLISNVTTAKASRISTSATPSIINTMLNACTDGWYDADDVAEYILADASMYSAISMMFYSYERSYPLTNTFTDKEIEDTTLADDIFKPFVKSIIIWMGCIGMFEISYDIPDSEDPEYKAYSDCVRSFRISEMGRSVLGLPNNYNRAKIDNGSLFIDENMLIVRAESDKIPGLSFIKEVSTPISNNRYKVTSKSFLSKCENGDVGSTIRTFKKIFGTDKFPQIWEDFFKELIDKSSPLEPISPNTYKIFRLKKADRELMTLLSTHKDLSQIVERATGHMILVDKHNLEQFRKILLEYGYSF